MGTTRRRKWVEAIGIQPTVPPQRNRRKAWCYDTQTYKQRNEIERLFRRSKGYRTDLHEIRQVEYRVHVLHHAGTHCGGTHNSGNRPGNIYSLLGQLDDLNMSVEITETRSIVVQELVEMLFARKFTG